MLRPVQVKIACYWAIRKILNIVPAGLTPMLSLVELGLVFLSILRVLLLGCLSTSQRLQVLLMLLGLT